jgi:ADP-ribose pyrophosphatase
METWVEKQTAFKGKIFSVSTGSVRLDDGSEARRDVIEHYGGAAIVPVLGDGVLLIRQFRISIERDLLELPAGRLEPNENPMECAARELEEEIGYRAGKLIRLSSYFASVGNSNERMYLFLALDLEKTKRHLEADERIREVRLSLEMVREKLANQEFEDSKTIIGLREALAYLERK